MACYSHARLRSARRTQDERCNVSSMDGSAGFTLGKPHDSRLFASATNDDCASSACHFANAAQSIQRVAGLSSGQTRTQCFCIAFQSSFRRTSLAFIRPPERSGYLGALPSWHIRLAHNFARPFVDSSRRQLFHRDAVFNGTDIDAKITGNAFRIDHIKYAIFCHRNRLM